MLLSPKQLAALADEIRKQHLGFVAQNIGIDAAGIDQDTYDQLVLGGYVTPNQVQDFVMQAYWSGRMAGWHDLTGGRARGGSVLEALRDARAKGMPPLSRPQERAVMFARYSAGQYCVGLGNRIADDLTTLSIETERAQQQEARDAIATETATSIIMRESAQKLASRLGDATGDWARNLQRIAETELQTAHQNGWADYIEEEVGPSALVAKRTSPDACPTCTSLLTDDDGNPKIFTLSELRANGTNFGRKQKQWLPVIGPIHPRCGCVLIQVPAGWGFNKQGQMLPQAAIDAEKEAA